MTEHPLLIITICSPTKATGDVISGADMKTIQGYILVNFEVASLSSFRENNVMVLEVKDSSSLKRLAFHLIMCSTN